MEVKFTPTNEDYWRYNVFTNLHITIHRNRLFANLAFVITFIVLLDLFYGKSWGAIFRSVLIVSIIMVGLYFLLLWYQSSRFYKINPGFFKEQTVFIDETGLREMNQTADLKFTWQGIIDIQQDKYNIYIYLESSLGYVIPKKSFSNENEANKFFRLATLYWAQIPDLAK